MHIQTKTKVSTRTKIIVGVLAVGAAAAAAAFGGGSPPFSGGSPGGDGKGGSRPIYQSPGYTSPGYKSGLYVIPTAGMLIRTSTNPAVYYYTKSGYRYVFPNEKTLDSWYLKKPMINLVKDDVMALIPLKGTVTYRPGARLLKITTDTKVYAVDKGGVLRWEKSEDVLKKTYGINWVKRVDDLPDAVVGTYKFGFDINSVSDYSLSDLYKVIKTVDDDILYK